MIATLFVALMLGAEPGGDRTDPQPPDDPRDPDPVPEPEPEPTPEPTPTPTPTPEPEPTPEPNPDPTQLTPRRDRPTGAPNVDVDIAGRSSTVALGGDIVFKPKCKGDSNACNGGRIGFQARFPVTQESPTGTERASVDALDGFVSSWRVGIVGELIRDVTAETGPAVLYQVGLDADWGVQTFKWFPEASDVRRTRTKHSMKGLFRFLAYVHQPRKFRIAPQLIVRYDRNWSGANPVGIVIPGKAPDGPATTEDSVIAGPRTRPVMTFTLPVLFTIQRGKRVLPQLGFGPTIRYAFAGSQGGYNPFNGGQTLRSELWLYWYPTGTEGLDVQKTNVRIGIAPYMDAFLVGRLASQPRTNFGALLEVKVGVRGYEY
ncbi:MAG TPA: hypothetical protein VG755_04165 [Nannocystaceae bacterium]|nr:hypothetical protein [Nannocystaceae bacterium]